MIRYIQSFKKKDDGSTAIEFAVFAIPFFLLIMGIIEIGVMFAAATIMNGAADDAARQIRTGQAQQSGDAKTIFSQELCGNVYALLDCDNFRFHVVTLNNNETFTNAISNENILPPIYQPDPSNPLERPSFSDEVFEPGEQNDRVIIRVSYEYRLLTPLAGPLLADTPGGNSRLFVSTVIVQNEPY